MSLILRQNYEKYLFYSTKMGQYTLFLAKKAFFLKFLFVFS